MRLLFSLLPKLAEALSESIAAQFLLLVKLWYFAITRKFLFKDKRLNFVFNLNGKAMPLSLWDNSDLAALIEIYVQKEYDHPLNEPFIIIDLGAHTGNTAIFFSVLYPDATVYAVEASPQTYAKLAKNVNGYKNIVPVFGAISDHDGSLTFYESKSSLGSSILKRSSDAVGVTVPCFTLQTLFSKFHIQKADFIKIDIEGAEEQLFKSKGAVHYANKYIIELHYDLMHVSKADFLKRFEQMRIAEEVTVSEKRQMLTIVD